MGDPVGHDQYRVFVLVMLTTAGVHFNVTEHPTAEWTARQLLEACALKRTRDFSHVGRFLPRVRPIPA